MEATIDRFGRIIIPKELRDLFGLKPGSTLEVIPSEQEITLRMVESEPLIARKNGVLIIKTEIRGNEDIVQLIRKQRDERLEKLIGPIKVKD